MTTFKSGVYYIGDPCYVLGENHDSWVELLEKTNYLGDGDFEYKGYPCHASGTAYGDGEYSDNTGQKYSVDAGLLSIIPISALTKSILKKARKFGNVVEFNNNFEVDSSGGIFYFGHITIDTRYEGDE